MAALVTDPDTPRQAGDSDAPHTSPVTPEEDYRTILINRVSWAAVFAGVVTALVSNLVLNLLGIGIGVATLDPGTGDNPSARGLSIGAGIWFALAGIISSFVGGYVAGRLSGRPKESTTGWHGVTAWALTTLLVFYLLTSAVGGIVGGLYSGITGALGGAGRAAGSAVQTVAGAAAPALSQAATQVTDPFGAIERQVREASGGNDPAALRDAAVTAIRAALTGDQAQAQAARDRAAQALARSANISPDEARNRVAQYEQQYRQAADEARRQATRAADAAARTVSRGALFGSLALILGGLAAWFGGRAGAVHPTVTAAAMSYARRRV